MFYRISYKDSSLDFKIPGNIWNNYNNLYNKKKSSMVYVFSNSEQRFSNVTVILMIPSLGFNVSAFIIRNQSFQPGFLEGLHILLAES